MLIDLLVEALILKDFKSEHAIEAADYVLNKSKPTNIVLKELASHFLEQPSIQNIQSTQISEPQIVYPVIANLKQSVRFYDKNPIAWCNMSLYYADLKMKRLFGARFNAIFIALRALSICASVA